MSEENKEITAEPVTGEPTAWSAQDHTEEYVQQGYITEQPGEDVVDFVAQEICKVIHAAYAALFPKTGGAK